MPIYTRTGDTGLTSLFGGKRVLKCEELVDVYGSIDELNSWVGLIASQLAVPDVQQFLAIIQSDLFVIGSFFAGSRVDLDMVDGRVKEMEARIDALEKELPKLRNFILPGGSQLGSLMHVARSICRRVERQTVALAQKSARNASASVAGGENVDPVIIKYLNRLSDLFFMLARFINKQSETPEIIWRGTPAKS